MKIINDYIEQTNFIQIYINDNEIEYNLKDIKIYDVQYEKYNLQSMPKDFKSFYEEFTTTKENNSFINAL